MKYDMEFFEHHWMPFTSNRDFKSDPRIVVRGEGVYLYSHEDKRILDGSSGLSVSYTHLKQQTILLV